MSIVQPEKKNINNFNRNKTCSENVEFATYILFAFISGMKTLVV